MWHNLIEFVPSMLTLHCKVCCMFELFSISCTRADEHTEGQWPPMWCLQAPWYPPRLFWHILTLSESVEGQQHFTYCKLFSASIGFNGGSILIASPFLTESCLTSSDLLRPGLSKPAEGKVPVVVAAVF